MPLPDAMVEFTPVSSLLGGLIIGLAVALFMLLNGRIAGISGIIGGLAPPRKSDMLWRVAFLAGLALGAVAAKSLGLAPEAVSISPSWPLLILGGGLVGLGTAVGGGCTSGHGICGIARLSRRSLVATGLFMAAAVLTVAVIRHLTGVS